MMTHPVQTSLPEAGDLLQSPQSLLVASLTRDLTPQEASQLEAWSRANPDAHGSLMATWMSLGIFAESEEMMALRNEAAKAAGLARNSEPRVRPSKSIPRPVPSLWHGLPRLSAAACLIAAIGWAGLHSWSDTTRSTDYTAPAKGITHLTLSDGTRVTLSAGTQIRTRMRRTGRSVELAHGDAFFEVIHDPKRPMTVKSQDHEVTDLGTVFNISQMSDHYKVTLVSGAVRVRNTVTGAKADLRPGQSLTETAHSWQVSEDKADPVINWAQGRLVFEDASLADVSVSYSRLTGRRLIFATPELARLHLSGIINLDRLEGTCNALSATLPVKAAPTETGDILISAR